MGKRNTVAFVRRMQREGYKQKQIKMVTKVSQASLSRIMNNKTYVTIKPEHYDRDEVLEKRLETLDRLMMAREIAGDIGLDENNKKYIKVLQYLGIPFDRVKEIYYDVSKKLLNAEWNYTNVDFKDFDSTIVNVEIEDFRDLIE